MNIQNTELYSKIRKITSDVNEQLKKNGVVAPIKNRDGSIKVGRYTIKKIPTGFYSIVDYSNEAIIEFINLPKSAAILANKLALGKFIDDTILNADRRYGHALFEEELQNQLAIKNIKKNQLDKASLMYTKAKISRLKKEHYLEEIDRSFEKLIKFR